MYTLVFLATILLIGSSLSIAESRDICSDPNPSIEQLIACYHLDANNATNSHYANLHKIYNPDTQLSPTQHNDLIKPSDHFVFTPGQEPKLPELCEAQINGISNVSQQCLLSKMLVNFYKYNSRIEDKLNALPATEVQFKTDFWLRQKDAIFDMMEANVLLYNQMFMTYPMHSHFTTLKQTLVKIKDELKKSSDQAKKLPNQFQDASTTECQ